jgi:hypothetical protein
LPESGASYFLGNVAATSKAGLVAGDMVIFELAFGFDPMTVEEPVLGDYAPLEGDIAGAYRLRADDYSGVINRFGAYIEAELEKYTDGGTALPRGATLDVNGQEITNVADATQDIHCITLGQLNTYLGI